MDLKHEKTFNKNMWTRPSKEQIVSYVWVSGLLMILFCFVYGYTNHWAIQSQNPFHLWFPFELSLPLIPEFIFIYFSLNILMLFPVFVLSAKSIWALGYTMAATILIAGLVFFFLPAPVGFSRLQQIPRYNDLFQMLYQWDQSANTFPSLHIALSFLTVRSLHQTRTSLNFLWIWFVGICFSVIFTHQHHLIDILGGILLSEVCFRLVYLKFHYK